jgi:hypothetical protein
MKTNELKTGDRVKLANGWYATIADNKKGNIRMATVEGIYTETGSVYSHDIVLYRNGPTDDCLWLKIEHTPAQLECKARDEAFM